MSSKRRIALPANPTNAEIAKVVNIILSWMQFNSPFIASPLGDANPGGEANFLRQGMTAFANGSDWDPGLSKGFYWYDTTNAKWQKHYSSLDLMQRGLFNQTATVTHTGVVTAQSLAGAGAGTRTLPANFFGRTGKALYVRLGGHITTDAAPGTGTITVKLGSTTYVTVAGFTLDASMTNRIWTLEGLITCRTTGATGTVNGSFVWVVYPTNATVHIENMVVTSAVTIDTTASQAVDVVWSANDAGTVMNCTDFSLWEIF